MAIIRGGKRIGPFDIRAGVSREDLKGVYDIGGDPRTRPGVNRRASGETTIGRFRSAVASAEGFARPSRFMIAFGLPGVSETTEENTLNGKTMSPKKTEMTDFQKSSRNVAIFCNSISFPGRNLSTIDRNTHGPSEDIVDGVTYGDISASFYCDKFMREKHMFELWQKVAFNPATYNVNFASEYKVPLEIYQLGSFSEQDDRDRVSYAVTCVDAFPKTIAAQSLGYNLTSQIHKVDITFSYKLWYNAATDIPNNEGTSFTEQDAGVLAVNNNGFSLPPGIRNIPFVGPVLGAFSSSVGRTIRDTGNQVVNQIPIGKVFGGKVFPPFI